MNARTAESTGISRCFVFPRISLIPQLRTHISQRTRDMGHPLWALIRGRSRGSSSGDFGGARYVPPLTL